MPKPLELQIYDRIGSPGADAKTVSAFLNQAGGRPVLLRINSLGGSCQDGLSAYAQLAGYGGQVRGIVEGFAASAASLVAAACRPLELFEGSSLIIHLPFMPECGGDANELRKFADSLDALASGAADIYVRRTGLDKAKVLELMTAETWLSAHDAVRLRFADKVLTDSRAVAAGAAADFSGFRKAPDSILSLKGKRTMEPATLAELKAALPRASADFILAQLEKGATVADAKLAFADHRLAELEARETKLPGVEGVKTLPHSKNRDRDGDAAEGDFAQLVNELVAKGTPRVEAVARIAKRHPDLHREFVEAHNPNTARIQGLIAERFGK